MVATYFINVDVYNDDILFHKRLSELSSYRREKTLCYRFRKDQNLSIGVGMLVDYCLQMFGIREKDAKYIFGKNGKPEFECINADFARMKNVHFNVSHSGSIAICSWGDIPVGVDIEKVEAGRNESIPYNMLAREEVQYLYSVQGELKRQDAFYRMWTLKESFVKVLGVGLSLDFDKFVVLPGEKSSVIQSVNKNKYYFKEYDIPGYKVSVCCPVNDFASTPIEIFDK